MTHRITFEVPGKIQPWQRTGANRHTQTESVAYKKLVAGLALVTRMKWSAANGSWPLDGRYRLDIETVTKDRRRLDISNVRKQVEDALSGVLYDDDHLVWAESGSRRVEPDERLIVTVEVIE